MGRTLLCSCLVLATLWTNHPGCCGPPGLWDGADAADIISPELNPKE